MYSFNGVFWTLALEEQLYLLYFVLVALRRRFGWPVIIPLLAAARLAWLAFGVIAHRSFHYEVPVEAGALAHWLTWGLGALAAEVSVGVVRVPRWTRSAVTAVLSVAGTAVAVFLAQKYLVVGTLGHQLWFRVQDAMWGIAFFFVIQYAVETESYWRSSMRHRSIALMRHIGIWSYSLYLTHELVIRGAHLVISSALAPAGVLLFTIAILPLTVLFAYAFFAAVERPAMKWSHAAQLTSVSDPPLVKLESS